jgi:hypothetical protein
MAAIWRQVVALVFLTIAIVIAMPNHTPSEPGVLHRREPDHTPSAPGVLHRREPDHTPSAPGVLHRREPYYTPATAAIAKRQMSTISAAAPTVTAAPPSAPSGVQVEQLIAGIGFNIMAQKAEIAVVSMLQSLGQAAAPSGGLIANGTSTTNASMLYQVAKVGTIPF